VKADAPGQQFVPPAERERTRFGFALTEIDWFDVAVVVVFVLLGLWTAFLLSVRSEPDHLWTETNGLYIGDQMQYLGWIRSSFRDILIGNPFTTSGGTRDFLNPALVVSEILVRVGISTWLSYLLWVPAAAVALALCVRALVRRSVSGTASRRIALVLALFYLSPLPLLASLFHWSGLYFQSYSLEIWPVMYLWGYPFTALTVAFFIGAILTYRRGRNEHRLAAGAPLCALLCAWLQPWQGATLLVLLVGVELYVRTRRLPPTPLRLLAATIIACAVPLVYFALLSRLDATWRLSGQVNNREPQSVGELFLTLLPLLLLAAFAYRRSPTSFIGVAVLAWPLCALAVFFGIYVTGVGTFPKHALQGIGVPLAVLAVLGFNELRGGLHSRALLVAVSVAVAALLLGPVVRQLNQARSLGTPTLFGTDPYFIRASESDALHYLALSSASGSVLSTVYLGQIVPAETGRNTWVGIASWTPDFSWRVDEANRLFSGTLSAPEAVSLVDSTGVRFLLSDCSHPQNLSTLLGTIVQERVRFGCASVYLINPATAR
jgi:hypothetical protein